MTIVHMSEKGQVIVPKEIREQHGWDKGSAFAVHQSRSGIVLFRPVNAAKPKLTFTQALRAAVQGIEIPERHHFSRPRI